MAQVMPIVGHGCATVLLRLRFEALWTWSHLWAPNWVTATVFRDCGLYIAAAGMKKVHAEFVLLI